MANKKLADARNAKNDEFYTQYADIQKEVNAYLEYDPDVFRGKTILLPCDDPEWSNFTKFFAQNFENFGIKKLISTSFAHESKSPVYRGDYQLSFFESNSPLYDEAKSSTHGKIFTLTRDSNKSGNINIDDLQWHYLEGDGDFRSDEVKALRDEADIIITNPPFSIYRDFIEWLFEAHKKFLIVGNKGSASYKEIFPLIMNNKMWSGVTSWSGGMWFESKYPDHYDKIVDGIKMKNVASTWFTNIEHGRRHQFLSLMSMADNIKYSKHKKIRGYQYCKYENYDAIDVPYTDAIPDDYSGVMGVPITFLEKYNPEQFEIIGCADANVVPDGWKGQSQAFVDLYYQQGNTGQYSEGNRLPCFVDNDGKAQVPFKRVLIRKR